VDAAIDELLDQEAGTHTIGLDVSLRSGDARAKAAV